MTDEELIARLREIQGQAGLFASAAADRIEALVKARREDALELLAAHGQAQDAYEAQLKAEARIAALTARMEKLRGAAINLLAAAIPFTLPDETDNSIAEFAAEHPEEGGYCLAIRKAVAATRAALTTEASHE